MSKSTKRSGTASKDHSRVTKKPDSTRKTASTGKPQTANTAPNTTKPAYETRRVTRLAALSSTAVAPTHTPLSHSTHKPASHFRKVNPVKHDNGDMEVYTQYTRSQQHKELVPAERPTMGGKRPPSNQLVPRVLVVEEEEEADIPTDDEIEESMDAADVDKQLVMWAGRLELESIDLREKSGALTKQLVLNSNALGGTVKELKTVFKEMKKTECSTAGYYKKVGSAQQQMVKMSAAIDAHLSEMKSLQSEIQSSVSKNSMMNLNRKIDSLPGGVKSAVSTKSLQKITTDLSAMSSRLNKLEPGIVESIDGLKVFYGSIMENFEKSLTDFGSTLAEIANNQYHLSGRIENIDKKQYNILQELYSLKSKIEHTMPNTPNQTFTLTPMSDGDNSFIRPSRAPSMIYSQKSYNKGARRSCTNRPAVYERRFKSRQQGSARLSTTALSERISEYTSLLSDDE